MDLSKPFESMTNEELLRFIAQNMKQNYLSLMITDAYTYDDVHLAPKYTNLGPYDEVSTETEFVKGLKIKVPLVSAAMDTVTDSNSALALARAGCVGVIHRNCTIAEQVAMVQQVKRHRSTMVSNPVTLPPEATIEQAMQLFAKAAFGTVPIVDAERKLLGIISKRRVEDFSDEPAKKVSEMMIPFDELHVAYENTDVNAARKLFKQTGKKRLPIIKSKTDHTLLGIYFKKDLDAVTKFPLMSLDTQGSYLVGAAIGVAEEGFERAEALIAANVDFLVIDTAQGHSQAVFDIIKKIKQLPKTVPVVGGNVVTAEGAEFLIDAGADAVKVGVGPGRICTTRAKTGNGKAQFSAVAECAEVCKRRGIPLIADGGIKETGDVVKALAVGAAAVMMGGIFAGTDEAPGETKTENGIKMKEYRGMGSPEAMKVNLANDRYGPSALANKKPAKKVAEGVSGWVVSKGPVQDVVDEYHGALVQSMRTYQGARTIAELQTNPVFTKITNAGQLESGVRVIM